MIARCPSPRCGHSLHEAIVYTPSATDREYGYTAKRVFPVHRWKESVGEPRLFSGAPVYDDLLVQEENTPVSKPEGS